MKFRITDLNNFVEIAGARTMREGAEKLGITQPALSESIKRLEQDLNEILFYRSRSGISLTPGGYKTAKAALIALSALNGLENNELENDSRLITIGCHPLIASYFLPKALKFIQKENPKYQIAFRHNLSRSIHVEVQQGKIDVAVVVNALKTPDLIIKHLDFDQFGVWQKVGLNGDSADRIFCNTSLFQTQAILRKWKDKPKNLIDTDSLELIVRVVREGLGYGILPARAIALLDAHNCALAPDTPTVQDSISIVYRPEFGKHPIEKIVVEGLKRSVK